VEAGVKLPDPKSQTALWRCEFDEMMDFVGLKKTVFGW
jgi:hypothetical protein